MGKQILGKNGNGNDVMTWEWVEMGMGMMLWEWEGAGTLKLIPAHLYSACSCPSFINLPTPKRFDQRRNLVR